MGAKNSMGCNRVGAVVDVRCLLHYKISKGVLAASRTVFFTIYDTIYIRMSLRLGSLKCMHLFSSHLGECSPQRK